MGNCFFFWVYNKDDLKKIYFIDWKYGFYWIELFYYILEIIVIKEKLGKILIWSWDWIKMV